VVPRRLIAVLTLLVVGLLGVGVTAAVRRSNDDAGTSAAPRVSASPTDDATTEPLPTDAPSAEPAVPSESPAAVPSVAPSPASTGSGGSGSGSGSGGSPQALGPRAPSMPETGPVTAVLFVGAISAMSAVFVHRRFFR